MCYFPTYVSSITVRAKSTLALEALDDLVHTTCCTILVYIVLMFKNTLS